MSCASIADTKHKDETIEVELTNIIFGGVAYNSINYSTPSLILTPHLRWPTMILTPYMRWPTSTKMRRSNRWSGKTSKSAFVA
jgi:hypothetical protein